MQSTKKKNFSLQILQFDSSNQFDTSVIQQKLQIEPVIHIGSTVPPVTGKRKCQSVSDFKGCSQLCIRCTVNPENVRRAAQFDSACQYWQMSQSPSPNVSIFKSVQSVSPQLKQNTNVSYNCMTCNYFYRAISHLQYWYFF